MPGGLAQKPRERDAKPARCSRRAIQGSRKAAKSFIVPQRARVGDIEAIRDDRVPP